MTYLVLARKFRPQNFDDVVGQDHITEILKKAIKADRIAHSYLFCGPRGIGKTSCARILAKTLNCEKGPAAKPCDKCSACTEILKGNSFDVLEIDGASNRGIDEIRALRENVKFAPSYGRYKIYIVDEVHMLTTEAFNALLKTLEEPPPHVKFIFATTEPNKVPATIISRCQRFDFKRIPSKIIVEALNEIGKKEGFKICEDAMYAIAKASGGSLRDALSVLDQISSISDKSVKVEDVYSMLGLVESELLFDMADALSKNDCVAVLKVLDEIIDKGKDLRQLVKDLLEHYRNLMIMKIGGQDLQKLLDYSGSIKKRIFEQSKNFSLKDILRSIDMFIETQESARITESIRMSIEVAFAKLTYKEEAARQKSGNAEGQDEKVERKFSPAKIISNNKGYVDIEGSRSSNDADDSMDVASKSNNEAAPEFDEEEEAIDIEDDRDFSGGNIDIRNIVRMWDSLTYALSRKKMSAATYMQEGTPLIFSNNTLTVGFSDKHTFHRESLDTNDNIALVEEVFSEKLNSKIIIKYVSSDDKMNEERKEDEEVKAAIDVFEGKIVSRWHQE
ncbi:MAG: DNA polymerase III subunit gamma/tau [Candidatus Omnitrophica bacterium]|nr:DNA polymerase III subunit gamma/tau [Candidatus Omnitrophota bacterium]MBU1995533.1 DNA polymerase III subunit gamma/tau [Candidatus Omnitrophota bacterium]MBU4334434.1 DNA polymerase III subunit gamma/tau [Candidatus Omnitrophota bacterium]